MNIEDYLQDAIELVNAWEIPEENFAQAVNDQALLMCGMNLDISSDLPPCSPFAILQF